MAIVNMQKLSICAGKKHRKAILELLQSMEVMEIRTDGIEAEGLVKMDTQSAAGSFERNADALDEALELLKKYAPDGKKDGGLFAEKELITRRELDDVVKDHQKYVSDAKDVQRSAKDISECRGAIIKCENLRTALQPWLNLRIPLAGQRTKLAVALVGTVPGSVSESELYAAASREMRDPAPVSVSVISDVNNVTYMTAICLRRDEEQVEANLREIGFAKPALSVRGIPEEESEQCAADIKKYEEQIAQDEKAIAAYGGERGMFRIVSDYYRSRAEKYRLLGTIPQSENVFFLEGWVPERNAADLKKLLEEKFGAFVETEEKREDEIEPTLLHNNRFSEPAESVLESYGLPQHGRVDPTFIMSIFYVFFFGMMLSDGAYGIIITVLCAVLLKKHPRMARGTQKMLRLFFWCGISTAFWGFMYGGFFGDAPTVFAQTFLGYKGSEAILKPLWFEPLANPMKLLVWCMLFGLIHLFTGLGIKGYEMLRAHDVVGFVSDIVSWYMFLLGLILLLLPTSLFESIAQVQFSFPPFVHTLSLVLTFGGMIIILLMSGRGRKNWALRIALGAYDIYGVTSWLSDVLSYSRLLALGLATGVIASVINMMAAMNGNLIVFIIIFILGHTLNIAINMLGAYVHTNRLQFVEFFGKFYDGGGEPFRPFSLRNKYVEIKEEK